MITLAIIGVVAALTIPTVVRNYREKQTVVQLKKVYSQLNSAFQMAVVENGSPENWKWGAADTLEGANLLMQNYFVPYLKVLKNCGITKTDCVYNGNYKTLNKGKWADTNPNVGNYARLVLADGTAVWFWSGGGCSSGVVNGIKSKCGYIDVDLNGVLPPNQYGVDTFTFHLTKYGIIPRGIPEDKNSQLATRCNIKSTNYANGYACAAWILQHENMDYLRKEMVCTANPDGVHYSNCHLE